MAVAARSTESTLPPFSLEAEQALIGAALLRQSIVGHLLGYVDPSDFLVTVIAATLIEQAGTRGRGLWEATL